ncbi:MAG: FAD-binding protein [Bacteroidetes bacterium]|nr:FAD-binding protein [Bacteroidota bacterium]
MRKKLLWITALLFLLIFIIFPVAHVLKTKWHENKETQEVPEGFTNDASQLNLTKVDSIVQVPEDKSSIIIQLKSILQYAKTKKLKVSIAGARHTMGGHTMYPNGVVIDMLSYNHMELDTSTDILTIGSGALWKDALKYLDKFGKSVAIMQAFSSFSVGGSISVNGHGWQKDLPPVSASVLSFSLLNPDGEILNCSRTENSEVFRLVTGGYGLFGIILDVKLKVADNRALRYHSIILHPDDYVNAYMKQVANNPKVNLVFGRLCVTTKHFLEEASLNYFEETNAEIPELKLNNNNELKRLIFRGSVDSEYGKRLRWELESFMNNTSENKVYSRNELLNDDVSMIENRDSSSTDLLHEYFIPVRNFKAFIDAIKPILKNSGIDLLNITIRGVNGNSDCFLNYAEEDVFGFVMLFNQKKTSEQETEMKRLTNLLVDAALNCGGTYYLPYRLHVEKDKMRRAYPNADTFFRLKLKYDPDEIFSNEFYKYYK